MVNCRLRRSSGPRVLLTGILPILDDIQVETTHIGDTKIVQFLVDGMKMVAVIGGEDIPLGTGSSPHSPAIQLQHILDRQQIPSRIETVEI